MGICYYCGKDIEMAHRCSYCNLTFCDDHRIPEKHNCVKQPNRNWDTYRKLGGAREKAGKESILKRAWRRIRG